MRAKIENETNKGFGVTVHDERGDKHKVGVLFDGSINGYVQDVYPEEPEDRTREQNERTARVRRYAQQYVAEETEYDTLPWRLDRRRIDAVRETITTLSAGETETHFGDLFDQSLSHFWHDMDLEVDEIRRPHDIPEDAMRGEDAVSYRQDVYLSRDADGEIKRSIAATSSVGISYYVARGEQRLHWYGDDPDLDREPDARLEVFPAPLTDPAPFRDYLAYNLRCQVRDCYLMMGLEPPEPYRVLGHGQYRFTGKYHHFDVYPPYHDHDADIDGYSHEFAPELPVSWSEVGGALDPASGESLYDQLKSTLFNL